MIDPEGFLNLPKAQRMRPVYRIMSLSRLFEMFSSAPTSWSSRSNGMTRSKTSSRILWASCRPAELVEFAPRFDFYGHAGPSLAALTPCGVSTRVTSGRCASRSGSRNSTNSLYSTAIGPAFIGKVRLSSRGFSFAIGSKDLSRKADKPGITLLAKTFLGETAGVRTRKRSAPAVYCSPHNRKALLHRHPFDCPGLGLKKLRLIRASPRRRRASCMTEIASRDRLSPDAWSSRRCIVRRKISWFR